VVQGQSVVAALLAGVWYQIVRAILGFKKLAFRYSHGFFGWRVVLCTKLEGLQSLYCLAAPQSTELNFPGRKYEMPFVFVVIILCA
jgi:hypothetical protein